MTTPGKRKLKVKRSVIGHYFDWAKISQQTGISVPMLRAHHRRYMRDQILGPALVGYVLLALSFVLKQLNESVARARSESTRVERWIDAEGITEATMRVYEPSNVVEWLVLLCMAAGALWVVCHHFNLADRRDELFFGRIDEQRCPKCNTSLVDVPADGRGLVECPSCSHAYAESDLRPYTPLVPAS